MIDVLIRRENLDTEKHTEGKWPHEAEIGAMGLQIKSSNAKDSWQPPETSEDAWNRSPSEFLE